MYTWKNFKIKNFYIKISKCNIFSTVLMGKTKIRMEFIKIMKKFFQFLLVMSLDEKNVIYVPELHLLLMLLGFQKFTFNLIHEDVRIWWCKPSS